MLLKNITFSQNNKKHLNTDLKKVSKNKKTFG